MRYLLIKSIFVLFIITNFNVVNAQSQTWNWVVQDGGSYWDIQNYSAADNDKNIYSVGYFKDETQQGDSVFYCNSVYYSSFLTKYDSNGVFLWSVHLGIEDTINPGNCYSYGVATDNNMNVYASGYFTDKVWFGDTVVESLSNNDLYIAKYNFNGDFQWVRTIKTDITGVARSIYTDTDGMIYLTGDFEGDAIFDQDTIISKGNDDFFLAKYDTNGDLLWVVSEGGTGNEWSNSVTVDTYGGVYITGIFQDTIHFETNELVSNGNEDCFVAKYNNLGNLQWVKQIGGNNSNYQMTDRGNIIKTNNSELVVSGYFMDTLVFASDTLISQVASNPEIFIALMDLDGTELWCNYIGLISTHPIPVGIDSCAIYGAGTTSHTINIEELELETSTNGHFIFKYNISGNVEWGTINNDSSYAWFQPRQVIAIPNSKHIYISGRYQDGGELEIGDSTFTSFGSWDCIVLDLIDNEDKCYNITTSIASATENSLIPIQLYPNPTKSAVNIDFGDYYNNIQIDIFSIDGRFIKSITKSNIKKTTVNLQMAKGLYFLHITLDNKKTIKKLLIN